MNTDPELDTLLSQPWSEGACRGYVVSAMERCGFKSTDIERVMRELHEVFDFISPEESRSSMSRAPIDNETFCPKVEQGKQAAAMPSVFVSPRGQRE